MKNSDKLKKEGSGKMKKEFVINVYEFTSDVAVEIVVGERINKLISEKLKEFESIIIDFSGVKILLTAFLKSAIGSFIEEYNGDFTNKVKMINLPEYSTKTLEKIVDVTKKSYRM